MAWAVMESYDAQAGENRQMPPDFSPSPEALALGQAVVREERAKTVRELAVLVAKLCDVGPESEEVPQCIQ